MTFIIAASGQITLVINCKTYTVPKSHLNYEKIRECLRTNDEEEALKLVDIPAHVEEVSEGYVTFKNGQVLYKGKPTDHFVASKIIAFARENLPVRPLVKFLDNLFKNPSRNAVLELYFFLENNNIPVTEDGTFLAYKRVRSDLTDAYSGTLQYKIGEVFEVERNTVDDNARLACSYGIHAGSLDNYVRTYGANEGWPILIVEINPMDVVACDRNQAKLRTCKFKPVGILDEVKEMPNHYHDWRSDENITNKEDTYYDDLEEEEEDDECGDCGEKE